MSRISSLPPQSCGWALPAKTSCTGRSASSTMRGEALGVAEEQRAALVGGEAAREADGQGVGIEDARRPRRSRRASPCRSAMRAEPRRAIGDQARAAALVDGPELVIGDVGIRAHIALSAPRSLHAGAEVALVERGDSPRDPGAEVDTVGDRADRHLVLGEVGPEDAATSPAPRGRAARSRRCNDRPCGSRGQASRTRRRASLRDRRGRGAAPPPRRCRALRRGRSGRAR